MSTNLLKWADGIEKRAAGGRKLLERLAEVVAQYGKDSPEVLELAKSITSKTRGGVWNALTNLDHLYGIKSQTNWAPSRLHAFSGKDADRMLQLTEAMGNRMGRVQDLIGDNAKKVLKLEGMPTVLDNKGTSALVRRYLNSPAILADTPEAYKQVLSRLTYLGTHRPKVTQI